MIVYLINQNGYHGASSIIDKTDGGWIKKGPDWIGDFGLGWTRITEPDIYVGQVIRPW